MEGEGKREEGGTIVILFNMTATAFPKTEASKRLYVRRRKHIIVYFQDIAI